MEPKIKDTFEILPIGKIKESKTNPRHHFNLVSLKELTESIKTKGVLVPVLVRNVNSHYEIVAGSRRFRASREAGLKEIPAIVKQLTDEEVLEAQVIENLQREDVHPIDEADGYQALLNQGKYDVKTLAEKLGKSEKYIYGRLRLNKLIKPIRDLFDSGYLQLGHLLLACRHNKETQEKILQYLQIDDNFNVDWENLEGKVNKRNKADAAPTIHSLLQWLNQNAVYDLSKVPFDISDKILYEKAGSCIDCRKNTTNELVLFEGSAKNLCTDRSCREIKTQMHLLKKFQEIQSKDPKAVCITLGHQAPAQSPAGFGKIYASNDYRDSSKGKCKDVKQCLVVAYRWDGDKNKLGSVTYKCFASSCKTCSGYSGYSGSSSGSGVSSAETKRRNEYNKLRKQHMVAMNVYRPELLTEVLKNLPADSIEFFRFLTLRKLHYYKGEKTLTLNTEVAKALGLTKSKLTPDDKKYDNVTDIKTETILKCKDRNFLIKIILGTMLDGHLIMSMWQQYESLKSDKQRNGDYLLMFAETILGKPKMDKIIKAAEDIHIKKPKVKKKAKAVKKTKAVKTKSKKK